MKKISLLTALGLAGCATAMPSITPPTAADVATRAAALTATGLQPTDYFAVGSLLVGETCHTYFRTLGDRAAGIDLASADVGLATGATMGLGAAAGMGAGGLATAGIVGTLVQGLFNTAKNSPVPYPIATGVLVNKAMAEYQAAAPVPATVAEAAMLVDAEAWLCSVPGATWLEQRAVATATPYAVNPSAARQLDQLDWQGQRRRMAVPPIVDIIR